MNKNNAEIERLAARRAVLRAIRDAYQASEKGAKALPSQDQSLSIPDHLERAIFGTSRVFLP